MLSTVFTAAIAASATVPCVVGSPVRESSKRAESQHGNLRVDLGYAVYEGFANQTTGLDTFLGIRFAAPPTGQLRWQAPQAPKADPGVVQQANEYGPQCPQSASSSDAPSLFRPSNITSEDCLFLNVWAPPNANDLPVYVWIHGGGYGEGNGRAESTNVPALINANDNSFVGVAIQYRLGAFGFLSSSEVAHFGTANAGLLDQFFALQWVQKNIHLFGGDPSRVTISGQSAGGGSVMLQTMAKGGTLGDTLFQNAFAISPYLPQQHPFNDFITEQSYYAFATQAGCGPTIAGLGSQKIFQCLVDADTITLQRASNNVSASGIFGTWAFLPVTDGSFLVDIPSNQLLAKRVNGKRMLTGNNANEGFFFTMPGINTFDELVAWLKLSYPTFNNEQINELLQAYAAPDTPVNPNAPKFATNGLNGPTAVTQGSFATGQQQRAEDIEAESTFICSSYWLAEGFNGNGRVGYKYQYSVPPAFHGEETSALFGSPDVTTGPEFVKAYQTMAGNFITKNNPSIPNAIANGASSHSNAPNPASNWPQFGTGQNLHMINFNETGGHVGVDSFGGTEIEGPGLKLDITLVNAYTFEGGRGARCDFWKNLGDVVPE